MMNSIVEKLKAVQVDGLKFENNDLVKVKLSPPVFERDGKILVSGEDAESCYFCDYYGELRGGYPWICPELEKFAKENGMYWEWENPACISLWPV